MVWGKAMQRLGRIPVHPRFFMLYRSILNPEALAHHVGAMAVLIVRKSRIIIFFLLTKTL